MCFYFIFILFIFLFFKAQDSCQCKSFWPAVAHKNKTKGNRLQLFHWKL